MEVGCKNARDERSSHRVIVNTRGHSPLGQQAIATVCRSAREGGFPANKLGFDEGKNNRFELKVNKEKMLV